MKELTDLDWLVALKKQLPPGYAIVAVDPGPAFFDDASFFWLNGNAGPGRSGGTRFAKAFRRMWAHMVEKAKI